MTSSDMNRAGWLFLTYRYLNRVDKFLRLENETGIKLNGLENFTRYPIRFTCLA